MFHIENGSAITDIVFDRLQSVCMQRKWALLANRYTRPAETKAVQKRSHLQQDQRQLLYTTETLDGPPRLIGNNSQVIMTVSPLPPTPVDVNSG